MTEAVAADRVDALLARRLAAGEAWFAAEADRLARLCREMASRFAAGGRLLAIGDVSDARHVAVEFVHPVIVGKRALPAIAVTPRQLDLLAEPRDMVIGFGADVSALAARGCLAVELEPPVDDPYVRQELVETAYHVLWELVHVFLEHSERSVHDTGAASFLYPFLGEQETDEDAVLEDVRRSILMKAEEVGALREQTLSEGRATLLAAAEAMRAGGRVLALGNGGSGNVIVALAEARRRGMATIALVGYDGGQIAAERLADLVVITRSQHIPRIQEAQASAYHVLCELVGRAA